MCGGCRQKKCPRASTTGPKNAVQSVSMTYAEQTVPPAEVADKVKDCSISVDTSYMSYMQTWCMYPWHAHPSPDHTPIPLPFPCLQTPKSPTILPKCGNENQTSEVLK